jgi:PPK2 family polyphosphate:nucleotide phosphotransferase
MPNISLQKISTQAPKKFDKEKTKLKTAELLNELNELQNLLFAEGKHSVLIVIQGMDASGKDGVIKNVFGKLNPQGVLVKSFKAPNEEELKHDFLWRVQQHSPAKGMIQVFNRSHYEDILITRVHRWCDDETAKKRITAINNYEQLLQHHNNTQILKFYLHISQQEQQKRLEERLKDPTKQWKYNAKDFEEAKQWKEYMKVYEEAFSKCNQPEWIITPSDQNWYKEHIIANQLHQVLTSLKMQYPGIKK